MELEVRPDSVIINIHLEDAQLEDSQVAVSDSSQHVSTKREKVWVVARCSLIVALASLLAGMNLGFSSPALLDLRNENTTTPAQLLTGSLLPSMFGVSVQLALANC